MKKKIQRLFFGSLRSFVLIASITIMPATLGSAANDDYASALSLMDMRRYTDAAFAFERFIASAPDEATRRKAVFGLGLARFSAKEYGRAIEAFVTIDSREFILDDFVVMHLAYSYAKTRDYEKSLNAYDRLATDYPNKYLQGKLTAENIPALCAFKLGRFDRALKLFVASPKTATNPTYLRYLHDTYRELGHNDKSIATAKKIYLGFPGSQESGYVAPYFEAVAGDEPTVSLTTAERLGRIRILARLKRITSAKNELEPIIAQEAAAGKHSGKIANLRAYIAYQNGELETARKAYQFVVDNSSSRENVGTALYFLAHIGKKTPRNNGYVPLLKRVATGYADTTYAERAIDELIKYGNLSIEDRIKFMDIYLAGHPKGRETARYELQAALLRVRQGKYERARKRMLAIVKKRGSTQQLRYWLTRIYRKLGLAIPKEYAATWPGLLAPGLYAKELRIYDDAAVSRETDYVGCGTATAVNATLRNRLSMLLELRQDRSAYRVYLAASRTHGSIVSLAEGLRKQGDYNLSSILVRNEIIPLNFRTRCARDIRLAYPLFRTDTVERLSATYGVERYFILAITTAESNFNSRIISPAGAIGLMQLMPGTYAILARKMQTPREKESLFNPEINMEAGAVYLRDMLKTFGGNIIYATAAYNAGPKNVKRWIKTFGDVDPVLFAELIPFRETRKYVKEVMGYYYAYHLYYDRVLEGLETSQGMGTQGMGTPLPDRDVPIRTIHPIRPIHPETIDGE